MMSDSAEEEINRRLTLLPAVLHSLDRQIKVALVQNDYIELDSFPIDKDGWETLEADCNINSNGILNTVKNPITLLQNQQNTIASPAIEPQPGKFLFPIVYDRELLLVLNNSYLLNVFNSCH